MSTTPGQPRHISEVAAELGLTDDDVSLHGRYRAKVHLEATPPSETRAGRYVLVTATTPTSSGSGKTVSAIGLSMGLHRLGHRVATTLRESALGPTFGMKGGGAGGGAAQVVPLEECLLRLGDTPSVEAANNLLAAVVDDAVHRGAGIDPMSVTWRRAVDVDDRALRRVITGLGGRLNGPPHETGFDITAASEVMALLALSRDLPDLRRRLDAVVPAWNTDGKPVTAGQLCAAGAMTVILRDAIEPNLMQTSEGSPVLVHTGPFGNLATGNSSVVADLLALPRVDYLVTEAGFGADLGAEKHFHLKCPVSGLYPDTVVLVTTIPSLREHGGGRSTDADVTAVRAGVANLRHHVRVLRGYGVPVVVTVNRFPGDTSGEVAVALDAAMTAGAYAAVEEHAYVDGGAGCIELADAVIRAAGLRTGPPVAPTYAETDGCEDKVRAVATTVYGAADVAWKPSALKELRRFEEAGYGHLPVCVAKTPLSLSHDPARLGAPTGFTLPIQEVRLAAGAGFLTLLTGDISTMPGLPAHPRLVDMDVDASGAVTGLV